MFIHHFAVSFFAFLFSYRVEKNLSCHGFVCRELQMLGHRTYIRTISFYVSGSRLTVKITVDLLVVPSSIRSALITTSEP